MTLEAIRYEAPPRPIESGQGPGTLSILDQLLLPHTTKYIPIHSAEDAFQAIRSMQVRGAPAIAIVAALSLCVELSHIIHRARLPEKEAEVISMIEEKLNHLLLSRPTAVNLGDAVGKLKQVVDASVRMGNRKGPYETVEAYIDAAEQMLKDDIRDNLAIGEHGADWILAHTPPSKSGKVSVLTHCNTGSLATSGHGTALGVIRTLHSRSSLHHAFFTETRPYNQGSRLTAYELLHDHIPSTLITDSMAASLLRLRASAEEDHIVAVVVGADRVAANGDTANKIGTYALAILARFHGVRFLVAAPRTTIDLTTPSGEYIVIEQRRGAEVTTGKGPRCDEDGNVYDDVMSEMVTIRVAAKGVEVWNPAFDVTPRDLIDGIITEKGVLEKNDKGEFELSMLFSSTAR